MSESLIKELDKLLGPSSLSCPYNIFLQSSIGLILEEVKALTKEKFLAVYNHLRENYRNYEEVFYKEVIGKLEEHLKRLKG
jgi:hypothetical protein